jgi:hypothetical protein
MLAEQLNKLKSEVIAHCGQHFSEGRTATSTLPDRLAVMEARFNCLKVQHA